jgi:energy-coupling factor transport system ATP-binding protein
MNLEEEGYEIILKNVTYKYPGSDKPALKNIDLKVRKGEILLITGPTGAGKTTLCNLINGLIPHFYGGSLEGDIIVHGINTKNSYVGYLSTIVGLLFQDPSSQLVTASVEDEIAFGLENLGLKIDEINERIDWALDFVGLKEYKQHPPYALSGGQQQACALASILAMKPLIYVLDEPTSNLDPIGSLNVFKLLRKISLEERKTILIVEHKLEELIDLVDRVIVMNEGKIIMEGNPREILGEEAEFLNKIGLEAPQIALFAHEAKKLGINLPSIPLTIDEGYECFSNIFENIKGKINIPQEKIHQFEKVGKEAIIQVKDVWFQYPSGTIALKGVTTNFYKGEFVAIIGQNGSGKTTLAKNINGLLRPTKGEVIVYNMNTKMVPIHKIISYVGYVFQNPDHQLFSRRVYDEIAFGPKNIGLSKEEIDKRVIEVSKMLNIENLLEEKPYELSKGHRQRIAIASILSMMPEVLIIDEPTTGQDPRGKREVMNIFKKLHSLGKTIIVITHDMNIVAEYAQRCIVMNEGEILIDGSTKEVFMREDILKKAHLKPPIITQLFKKLSSNYNIKPDVLTVEEAINVLKSIFKVE